MPCGPPFPRSLGDFLGEAGAHFGLGWFVFQGSEGFSA